MKLLRILLAILIVITVIIGYGYYHFMYSMDTLPQGEFLKESTSPNGEYTVRVYVNSPALSSDAIRCEAVNNKKGTVRNIFWAYKISDVVIDWLNDEMVVIDGKVLNIRTDHYDYRRN